MRAFLALCLALAFILTPATLAAKPKRAPRKAPTLLTRKDTAPQAAVPRAAPQLCLLGYAEGRCYEDIFLGDDPALSLDWLRADAVSVIAKVRAKLDQARRDPGGIQRTRLKAFLALDARARARIDELDRLRPSKHEPSLARTEELEAAVNLINAEVSFYAPSLR